MANFLRDKTPLRHLTEKTVRLFTVAAVGDEGYSADTGKDVGIYETLL